MERARRQVRLATRDATCSVLVVGPEGAGREHIARTIHVRRAPHGAPILPLACPLLDAELLETSLQAADAPVDLEDNVLPPTLLLLDVNELSGDAQKVLADRLMQHPQLALLSTAKRDLLQMAADAALLPQLTAALSTLVIRIPDLQQRVEDLPLLSQMILEQWNATGGRQFSGLTDGALDLLALFPWRRGIDELREVVHHACRSATGPRIQASDLPHAVRMADLSHKHPPRQAEPIDLDHELAVYEQRLIQAALDQAKGNKAQAARLLGVPRTRLLRRLEHFKLT